MLVEVGASSLDDVGVVGPGSSDVEGSGSAVVTAELTGEADSI